MTSSLRRARTHLVAGLLVALVAGPAARAEPPGRSRLDEGARLYGQGLLTSGTPVRAVVEGDVEVTGQQLSCATCHGRSGMGSVEGRRVVPPIAAPFLATPRNLRSRPRPPYDDQALARAIRDGVDSAGNPLDPLMPRYRLGERDSAALVSYLRQVSAQPSPGVEGDEIHLATVVAPGADPEGREAMLRVLEAYARLKTANAVDNRSRHSASWPEYYGKWVLHVWSLSGPPSTWQRQLEAQYRARPVFAVVSGIGGDEWRPVHRFCEEQHLPCLLPNVPTPPEGGQGWYSLYFSGGTTLEAGAIASRLAREARPQRVLQVYAPGGPGERAAQALGEALRRGGRDQAFELALAPSRPAALARLQARARQLEATAVVLWLGPAELAALGGRREGPLELPAPTFLSSTLLGGDTALVRKLGARAGTLVQPFAPDREADPRFRRVSSWLASQQVPSAPRARRIEDQTFFALTVFSEGFMHLKKTFQRDYLLECVDHFSGFENFSSFYPHLSFGPGQRVLSKGGYLIPLQGEAPPEWVVP